MPDRRRLAAVALAATSLGAAALVTSTTVLPAAHALAPSPADPPAPRRSSAVDTITPTTAVTTLPTTSTIATHDARPDALADPAVVAPVHLAIPAIDVDAAVAPTGVDAAGRLAIPDAAQQLVWWRYGPTPGAAGSAVIAGHVDWAGELGTFAFLDEVAVGDALEVGYTDGHTVTFTVTDVALVAKAVVPEVDTFARDGAPVLRLVTCGGAYDADVRSYLDNVIVTAVPALR